MRTPYRTPYHAQRPDIETSIAADQPGARRVTGSGSGRELSPNRITGTARLTGVHGWVARMILSLALMIAGPRWIQAADSVSLEFNRDIRPILSENCFACHGPDQAARKADLRLDTPEGAFAGLSPTEAIIKPGDPDRSELYRRIIASDPDDVMPPPKTGKTLSAAEKESLRQWIQQGAPWERHWAFQPIQRPALPVLENPTWARNPIDLFVLERLEREGLEPNPEAPGERLVRRASLDLTGLPPSLDEVDAFLNDESPDAYENLVDRLLDSTRYGEHRARYWLDAARYADTHGYHIDAERVMWRWREWVINAFNDNKPFDTFITEQVAGDLLPNPTIAQQIATGFNRHNMTTGEGGAIAEEYLVKYGVDRVDTTSTVFLGLTMACAQCHDHKYDPITQEEFYKFFAFFRNIPEPGLDGNRPAVEPFIKAPTPLQAEALADLDRRIDAVQAKLDAPMPELDRAFTEWLAKAGPAARETWTTLDPSRFSSAGDATLRKLEDKSLLASGPNPARETYEVLAETDLEGIQAVLLEVLAHESLPQKGTSRASHANFVLSEFQVETISLRQPENMKPVQLTHAAADYSQKNYDITRAIDGDPATGWAIDGKINDHYALFTPAEPFGFKGGTLLRITIRQEHGGQHNLGRFRLAVATDPKIALAAAGAGETDDASPSKPAGGESLEPAGLAHPLAIDRLLAIADDHRSDDEIAILKNHFRRTESPEWSVWEKELADWKGQRAELEKAIPTTLVMKEMDAMPEAFILKRGEYDHPGEKVAAGIPAVLPPVPGDLPANRLGLSRWLVDRSNPLTARVTINRVWHQVFGAGIVRTVEDFGTQGSPPTHPRLLDWLAAEFVDSGWDLKHMLRLMVTSSTYRQASAIRPEVHAIDPHNRLLARGPRYRMDAEMLRDTALSVGGLLVETIGGPSVKPYQPPGIWEAVSYGRGRAYSQDQGEKLYRRSLYTFWKRTAPPPSMLTFDAPSREMCVVRRPRTNTPLQALVLMNDPQFVEAARGLATRAVSKHPDSADSAIRYAFRLATSRRPDDGEVQALKDLVLTMQSDFEADLDAARDLISVGEMPASPAIAPAKLAAWTVAASTLLNTDEFVTK